MIELYDQYNQESKDLHTSLKVAGLSGDVLVIGSDGFLPEGFYSPFDHYVLEGETGKPLFFNQVPVPDFWEILGDNNSARICNLTETRAQISYVPGHYKRLVYKVAWLDKSGVVRQTDHYNRYGFCHAQTTHDQDGQAIHTKYLTRQGQERILENHLTGDILLSLDKQPLRHFANRIAFVVDFLQTTFGQPDQIIFNTLATSFLVSFYMEAGSGKDYLVWQEPLGDTLPGNMLAILDNDQQRPQGVLIPNKATYQKALDLATDAQKAKIHPMGYVYDFVRKNANRKNALIATHSDQIEQLEPLIKALPDLHFRIAAVTEMSPKLLAMGSYPNVTLYPNASQGQLQDLYQVSDLYLDINYQGEMQGAIRRAFLNRQLILAFSQTAHDLTYTASQHIFDKDDLPAMIAKIQAVLGRRGEMEVALEAQAQAANALDVTSLSQALNPFLGGLHD